MRYQLNRAELARFNKLIGVSDQGCWEWQGEKSSNGYGRHSRGPGHPMRAAHRISWEHFKGPITEGMELDHLCRNRACVNPEHLEEVTKSENITRQDHANRRKTHCSKGHEFTEENTHVNSRGKRVCRACDRARKS